MGRVLTFGGQESGSVFSAAVCKIKHMTMHWGPTTNYFETDINWFQISINDW